MARTTTVVANRREQIIDAAMLVFAQKGFDKATNKDIANQAGITPGLIYHYFQSKDELLRAAVEQHSPLHVVHPQPADLLKLAPEAFLRFMAHQILTTFEEEQFIRLLCIFLPEVIHHPDIAPLGLTPIHEIAQFVGMYLTSKAEMGELRTVDSELLAQILVGSIFGIVLRRQILRDPMALKYSQEEIIDMVVAMALSHLLTP